MAVVTYERVIKDKGTRDELVNLHALDEGQWVLVRHESPHKLESKWFGPYQIIEKKLLGTYRLQDPNGKELAALVHGNRLIQANIRTTDELRRLWASPSTKDALRRQNARLELIPSDPENTKALETYLMDLSADELDPEPIHSPPKRKRVDEHPAKGDKRHKMSDLVVKVPYK